MKKTFLTLASVALLFATSCTKESVNPAVDVPEGAFLATIDNGANPQNAPVVKDGMSTKTTINANRYVIWDNNDQIAINGEIYTTNTSGNSVVFSGGNATGTTFHAFYPASIAGTGAAGTLPATQTYVADKVSNLPMYATSNNNQLTFHNICAVVKFTVPSFLNGATRIELSSDQRMNGAFSVDANYKAVMSTAAQNNADKMVTIAKSSTGTFATDEVVYIAVPAQAYTNLKIEVFNGTESWWNSKITSHTLDVNKIYKLNDPNLLPGVFSVSATKKVRFTKGNIMGDATNGYHFASSQLIVCGYQPWIDFNGNPTMTIDGETGYYMLSGYEVSYMLGSNGWGTNQSATPPTKTSGVPYYSFPVTIDGKKDFMVIYPDNYTNTNPPSSYTTAEWAEAERAGCVCLASMETAVWYNQREWNGGLNGAYTDHWDTGYRFGQVNTTNPTCFLRLATYYNPGQYSPSNLRWAWWDLLTWGTGGSSEVRLTKVYSGN